MIFRGLDITLDSLILVSEVMYMKKRLVLTATVLLLIAPLLTGCLYREYRVGGIVSYQERNFVRVRAQLWYVVGSGMFDHIDWLVEWGDGTTSDTDDGSPVGAGNFSPSNPLTMMEWAHAYTQTGSYVVSITCSGSPAEELEVTVTETF